MSRSFRVPLLAAGLCLSLCALPVCAAQVDAGEVYCFSPLDFSGEAETLSGVCITALPPASAGTLRLGDRIIRTGDVLTAGQLAMLTFCPVSAQADSAAVVRYLPVFGTLVAGEAELTISIRGRQDDAPVAEDTAIETYKNLPAEGLLPVSDPEGQALVYSVIRQPRRGSLILREDGSYLYTPEKNKVGTDSFTFTATDPAGNVSRQATVTIKILKPTDGLQYSDTVGLSCRFSAEWLRNTGIFAGEQVGAQLCFSPEQQVSRGQFLAMLMQTLELPVDHSVTVTGFLDEAPQWLRPYLAAALRSGLITGYRVEGGCEFRPEQAITGQEAQVMLRNALDFALPAWAADGADSGSELVSLGTAEGPLTRGQAAELLYQAHQLRQNATLLGGLLS